MQNDHPLLLDTGNGFTVFYKDRHLYSSKVPRAAAVKAAREVRLQPRTLIFIPSVGLGYGFAELLEKLPPDCRILCVERDDALMALAGNDARFPLPRDSRLQVIRTDELLAVQEIVHALSPASFRRVVTLPLSGGMRLFPDFYKAVEDYLISEVKTYWQNKMTLIHMGPLYIKNMIANLPLLSRANDLSALDLDTPVLVIGAGPSLQSTLPLIKKLRSAVSILAVDTALPVLLGEGIVPDLIFALEPQFINIRDFLTLSAESVPVIADITSSPQVVRYCHFRKGSPLYFFSSAFHPLSLLERMKQAGLLPFPVPPLGSVGVAAVVTALSVTERPVLLAGLDFSFPFFRTHARGAPVSLHELFTGHRLSPVGSLEYAACADRPRVTLRDKRDRPVQSDLVLSSYAENLGRLCRGEKRVFDLNPLGIKTGVPLLLSEPEVRSALAAHPSGRGKKKHAPSHWNAEALGEFLRGEQELIRQGVSAVDRLLGRTGSDSTEAALTLAPQDLDVLEKIAHVYYHFPGDNDPPRWTPSVLPRVRLFLDYYAERIKRALTFL